MATISANTEEKIFSISKWGGLHENPDGDTKLKLGEAAVMRNFTITRDGNLRRRAGTKTILSFADAPVKCLWSGRVMEEDVLLAACGGHLWKVVDGEKVDCGELNTDDTVHIFPFAMKAYILNGHEYYEWDGTTLKPVEGYRPLVTITVPPAGGGENLEQVNKLNGKRHSWFSPDGTAKTFTLPEKNIQSIDFVKSAVDGSDITGWTVDRAAGTVTFSTAPVKGVSTLDIGWTMATNYRNHITKMRYSEMFDGTQDTRVFVYGDGSNECIYSEIDYNGDPRADYFPDLNVCHVGDANTPITALIRHFSRLICYKTTSAWSISASNTTLADGLLARAFYIVPTNKVIGNEAMGQVQLVMNSPRTVHGADVWEWRNNSSYSSNLTIDERQAYRVSDRVNASLKQFDLKHCYCFDDNYNQEYFVCYDGQAIVQNYAADAWYYWDNFPVACMVSHKNELYIGTPDGRMMHMSYNYLSDDAFSENAHPIVSYWESGSMSFGTDFKRKYSAQLWIGLKPESGSKISVTVQTDRKSSYVEKDVATDLAGFNAVDFGEYSFKTNRKPQMTKLKIKAKKFVFYKLIFEGDLVGKTATVLAADIRVRFTGYAK